MMFICSIAASHNKNQLFHWLKYGRRRNAGRGSYAIIGSDICAVTWWPCVWASR